jgi:hypothetical protein
VLSEAERAEALKKTQALLKQMKKKAEAAKPPPPPPVKASPKPSSPPVIKPVPVVTSGEDHYHYAVVHLPGGVRKQWGASSTWHSIQVARNMSLKHPGFVARAVRRMKGEVAAETKAMFKDGVQVFEEPAAG